jgi:O-antigen ligase
MFSGEKWNFTIGDFLILIALVLLFVEIVKATRTSSREIINHGLSMLTFVISLIEFITIKGFSTSAFFFIMAFTIFDVVGGYTISIVAAEHDLGMGRGASTD